MNINDFISPFDVLAGENWQSGSALHADVSFTLANSFLFGVWGGFDLAPGAPIPTLKIIDGGTVRVKIPITQDGPFAFVFKPAIGSTNGANLQIVLEDGGAGVTGYLNVATSELSPAAPALIQQHAVTGSVTSELETFLDDNPAAGNSIIVCVVVDSLATIDQVRLDEAHLNLTRAGNSVTNDGVRTEIWYAHDIAGGADCKEILVSLNNPGGTELKVLLNAQEWSGLRNAAPAFTNHNTGTSSSPSSNPAAPGSARALLIAVAAWNADAYDSGPTNSFTRLTQTGAGAVFMESAYRVVSVVSTYQTGWGLSESLDWAAAIAAFAGN